MVEKQVTVGLRAGLHARPAALFVQEANKYASDIFVEKNGKAVNAKSIMGIMSLAISNGTEVIIKADGADAAQAVEKLAELIEQE
ncbi:MAG: HPr family phosphocarrier protein [Tumebacillaceae bacterium]